MISGSTGSEEEGKAQFQEMASRATIESCDRQFEARFPALEKVAGSLTDDQLANTMWLPYDGGRYQACLEILVYARWSLTYHSGPLAYTQTPLGANNMF